MHKCTSEENGDSSSVTGSEGLVRLQICEKAMGWCTGPCKILLFCVKTIVEESRNFELACLKKKKERKTFWPSDDFLVQYFHNAFSHYILGVLLVMKTLENEWYINCNKGL